MLTNLPQLTKDQVRLHNLSLGARDLGSAALGWLPQIIEILSNLLKDTCFVEFSRVSIESTMAPTGTVFSLSWPPKPGVLFLELDTKVLQKCAYKAIDVPEIPENLDPKLSDLEQGIVSYLLSSVIEATGESFQLVSMVERPAGSVLCVSCALKIGALNSLARVWVPEPLLAVQSRKSAIETGKLRCDLSEVVATFELGKVDLTQEELNTLEPGDIVILESASLSSIQANWVESPQIIITGSVAKDEQTEQYSFTVGSIHG